MATDREKANGRVGLANLGNTCYINSIIQPLRYCKKLEQYFKSETFKKHLQANRKSSKLVSEIADVFNGMSAPEVNLGASMSPRGLIAVASHTSQVMGYDCMVHGNQNDSGEFLQFILEAIHSGVSREVYMEVVGTIKTYSDDLHVKSLSSWTTFFSKEYSPVVDNFYCQTMAKTTCNNCNNKSLRFEPVMILKVPISEKEETISSCIEKLLEKEELDDYDCENCKIKGKATLEYGISRLPLYLIIQLKRFNNSGHKIRKNITVNLDTENMAPFLAFPGASRNISTEYTTFAVVEHHGSSRGGHYVSYAKHDDSWLNYDDTGISSVTADRVINNDSYILFMMRK